jgi:predicted N-acetyltransferase YhbS
MQTIEAATLEDIPQLADLLNELFTLEAEFTPDRQKQLDGLRQIIEQPEKARIFVLRDGPTILASVNLQLVISTAQGGTVVILEDLIVRGDNRGKGLGSVLLQYAIQFAKASGYTRITVLTDPQNAHALHVYRKAGFARSEMVVLRMHL